MTRKAIPIAVLLLLTLSAQVAYAFLYQQKSQSITQTILNVPVFLVGASSNWLDDWEKRVKITVDHNDIDSVLYDFPVLVHLSDSSGPNNKDVSYIFDELGNDANRKKIAVTTGDAVTQCYVEIEKWNDANEQAWLWVKVPVINSTADTDLYLYYDISQSDNTAYVGDKESSPAQSVWDTSFKGVWHLDEDPSDTAPQMRDSTSNNNDGTSNGMMTSGDQIAGEIDGSLDFDGTDDYIQTTSNELETLDDFTLSLWFKADSTTAPHHILWEGPASENGWGDGSGNPNSHEMHLTICKFDADNTLNFFYGFEESGGVWAPAVEVIVPFSDTTNWYHAVIVMTGAGTSPSAELFLNGVPQGTDTGTQTNRTDWDTNLRIGRPGADQRYFDGVVDEVRISETARSGAWIKASYESGRDDLLDFGSEDYVDNNTSDVDSSADKGTHSDFSAQQAGPDGVYDVLTEQDTNGIVFEQVTVQSEQSTTNMGWTDVPGATVSFQPASTTEEWLVFVTGDIGSNSTSEDQARFRYDISGTPKGETGVQQGTTSTFPIDPYNVYFHFNRVTGVASQQTVKFQFQAFGATAYARNIHILCIRLDSAGLQYTEVNGDVSITGSQTLATLQFTPSSAGDFIVAYCGLVSELPVSGGGAETWLDYNSGTSLQPDVWTTPNIRRVHADRVQFEPHGLFTRFSLDTAQHTFRVQTQLRVPTDTSTARDVRIAAFRVDAFDLLEYDEDTPLGSTTGANTVRSLVNTAGPGEQRDYLILAGIHTISSGTSSREAGGVEIDDVFVQRKGDQMLSYTEIARIASHCALVETSSVSFKVETTYGTGGVGTDTIYSKQSVIYVLKIPRNYELDLEAQWTSVDYDEADEELCINAKKGSNTHSLDATGGYMLVGDGTPNWGSTTGTISFWVKWDTVANRPWGQHDNMETRMSGSNLVVDWGVFDSIISSTSFVSGRWYFVAVVWDENTDDLYLYVGDEDNPPALDTYNSNWFDTVSDEGVTQNNFMASKNGFEPMDGHGDDLRYWDTNRTLAQIQSDYNQELIGSETNLRSYFKLNNNFDDIGPNNNVGSGSGSYSFSSDVVFDAPPTEDIRVDFWIGSAWQNLFANLSNGWNNISVSSYLTSSTFTIRFNGAIEAGDTTQDSWKIDATLLNVWTTPMAELSKFNNKAWTPVASPSSMGGIYSIDSSADYWLVGDSNRTVWKYDGQSFTDVSPTSTQFNGKITAIGWGNGYWLVGDKNGLLQKYGGASWTDLTNDAGFNSAGSPISAIEWDENFGYWLVGGNAVVKRFDGTSWTDVSPSARTFEGEIGGIGCGGSMWLIGDLKGVVQKYDGSSWTDLTSDAGFYSSEDSVHSVQWGSSQFLVGAKNGKVKTFDGSTWIDRSGGWGSSDDVYTIEWSISYSYWLLGGEKGTIKSFDGSSWTDRTSDAGFTGDVRATSIELGG